MEAYSWKVAIHKAISYTYVALWDRKYAGKRFLATRVVPGILVALSVLELLGAAFHLFPGPRALPENLELVVSALLAVVALSLVWHHRRQEKRIKKSEAVLVALRAACVDKPRGPADLGGGHAKAVFEFMHDLLTKTVFALSGPTETPMHVTILVQQNRDDEFRIFDQFPSGTFPATEIALDPAVSSAAICAENERNTILYIPKPDYLHGIRMTFVNAPHTDATSTQIVENAFQDIGKGEERRQNLLKCFAAIQIPKELAVSNRLLLQQLGINPDSRLILCLGRSATDSLGPLEFNVLLAIANLLSMAFE